MTDTYGVGEAAKRKNVGPTDSTVAKQARDGSGKVDIVGGGVLFDPAVDKIELRAPDGEVPGDPGVDPNAAPEEAPTTP